MQQRRGVNPTSMQLAEATRVQNAGDPARAMKLAQQVVKREPRNAQALYIVGSCQLALGSSSEAAKTLARAAKLAPRAVPVLHNLSKSLSRSGRLDEAHAPLDQALRVKPDDQLCLAAKIELLITQGRHDEAEKVARPALDGGPPHPTLALAYARLAPRIGRASEAIEMLRDATRDESVTPANRMLLFFQLGRLLDEAERYGEAFDAYREGNALYAFRFDAAGHEAAVDRMIHAWSREAVDGAATSGSSDDRPVFIVGMPRSGTSLVEQILDSHPGVVGLGERPDVKRFVHEVGGTPPGRPALIESPAALRRPALDRFARSYAQAFRKAGVADRYTDKMPDNFLHLGVIALAFPRARVIHCRRDPMDTCLSCYFQHFGGSYPYVYELEGLGLFYRTYDRLMAHWASALDLPVLRIDYEALVADQEARSRRLIEFVGLEWDDACLRFHESKRVMNTASNEQVRRPVYASSVKRHEHYAAHLEPLRRALQPQADT